MDAHKQFDNARIARARAFANQPWKPDGVVCPLPEKFEAAKVYSRMVTLRRQIERMVANSTK